VIGGGLSGDADLTFVKSAVSSETTWRAGGRNIGAAPGPFTVMAICANVG
jgi:hypothetical protein